MQEQYDVVFLIATWNGKVFRMIGAVEASALMNRLDFRESEAVTNDRRTAKEVKFACETKYISLC